MERVSTKEIIVVGVVGGLTIQAIHSIYKNKYYKSIWGWIKEYPGFTIVGVTCLTSLALLYTRLTGSVVHTILGK